MGTLAPTLWVGLALVTASCNGGGVRTAGAGATPRAAARVQLPARADGITYLEDNGSRVAIGFALEGALPVPVSAAEGVARFPRANGTEDLVAFDRAPAEAQLRYDVDVTRVAGLRLVANTLEFLDAGGVPRLRVDPPSVIDAAHVRRPARSTRSACPGSATRSGAASAGPGPIVPPASASTACVAIAHVRACARRATGRPGASALRSRARRTARADPAPAPERAAEPATARRATVAPIRRRARRAGRRAARATLRRG